MIGSQLVLAIVELNPFSVHFDSTDLFPTASAYLKRTFSASTSLNWPSAPAIKLVSARGSQLEFLSISNEENNHFISEYFDEVKTHLAASSGSKTTPRPTGKRNSGLIKIKNGS